MLCVVLFKRRLVMNINKFSVNVLMASIILLPFTAMPYCKEFLRELSQEGAAYALIIAVLFYYILILKNRAILVYQKSFFKILLFFVITVLVGLIVNYDVISDTVLAGERNGLSRFATQLMLLLFGISAALSFEYFIHEKYNFDKLLKAIKVVFFIIFFFAFIEILAYELGGAFLNIYKKSIILFSDIGKMSDVETNSRGGHLYKYQISSVSSEPAHMGFTFAVLGPYFILGAIKEKKAILILLYIIVGFLSYSTSLYFVLLVQLVCITYYVYYRNISFIKLFLYAILMVFIFMVVLYPFTKSVINSAFEIEGDSRGRLASMYIGFMVWIKNNILFGVGLGQNSAYAQEYMPEWVSYRIRTTLDEGERVLGIHSLLFRILSECGIIGGILFLSIILQIMLKLSGLININKLPKEDKDNYVAAMLSIGGISFSLLFTSGNIAKPALWIAIGMGLSLLRINKERKIYSNIN